MRDQPDRPAPRDLLAARLRRLEGGVAALGRELAMARARLGDATDQLDRLIDLVGRLGRVVDVQGTVLRGDEDELGRQMKLLAARLDRLEGHPTALAPEAPEDSGSRGPQRTVSRLPLSVLPKSGRAHRALRPTGLLPPPRRPGR